MTTRLKTLACAATLFAIAPMARPALAANRGFSGELAVPESSSLAGCLSRANGVVKNVCSTSSYVYLPMSFDGAAWYTTSVYGQGWIDASGARNTIWCRAFYEQHDNSFLGWSNGWQQLPSNGFGGPQSFGAGQIPIYSPGDAGSLYCYMTPNTTLFTYGWN
jgi:hypothetical protein